MRRHLAVKIVVVHHMGQHVAHILGRASVKHLRVLSEPNGFERFERFLNDSERSNFIFELNRDLVCVVVAGPLDIATFGIAI